MKVAVTPILFTVLVMATVFLMQERIEEKQEEQQRLEQINPNRVIISDIEEENESFIEKKTP